MDKLIEILNNFPIWHSTLEKTWMPEAIERLAEYLLKNNIIVPECNVGDELWFETWENNGTICVGIQPHKVDRIDVTYVCDSNKLIETKIPNWEIGKRVFTTKEDCEEAVNKYE